MLILKIDNVKRCISYAHSFLLRHFNIENCLSGIEVGHASAIWEPSLHFLLY